MSWNAKWIPAWDALLGTMPDQALAEHLGVRRTTVSAHRRAARVKRFSKLQDVPCSICGNLTKARQRRNNLRCHDCLLTYNRELHKRRKGRIDSGKWCRDHKAERRAYMAKWREKNRAKVRRYSRNYARRVYRSAKKLIAELPCIDCGMHHSPERRAAILRRMLPCHTSEIHDAWPCIWGGAGLKGSAGEQRLRRDLKAIGAQSWKKGEYYLPQRSAA